MLFDNFIIFIIYYNAGGKKGKQIILWTFIYDSLVAWYKLYPEALRLAEMFARAFLELVFWN